MGTLPRRLRLRRRRTVIVTIATAVVATLLVVGIWAWWLFAGGVPALDGTVMVAGLTAPVTVQRDAEGVPTVTAANRLDLARALGFLHGQERFFQMDLLRRAGAGELSELVGAVALPIDRERRIHRFRARAGELLARMPAPQQALLKAYTDGVNAGLDALRRRPFEYTILRADPVAWRETDTLLAVYAMYFDLQDSDAWAQRRNGLARQVLGPALATFLYPRGTPYDAAIDGSTMPEPPIPETIGAVSPAAADAPPPPPTHGSNAFAVAGSHTATGGALVANDMHLGLNVPDIWYRARLKVQGAGTPIDLDGVTLPGTPFITAGSNGHVAWGFTDGYIATGDAVLLDPVPGEPNQYLTPDGPKPLSVTVEKLCPIRAECQDLPVEETVWGPVVGHDAQGRRIVWRWVAQDADAVQLDGILALETATTVQAAIDAAHHTGIPQNNFVVGDHDGHIGWTIIGHVPHRIGLDENVPQSWADGTRGWQGNLPPDQVPSIVDPPDGIIWTANNRVVGGPALALLGDGGYVAGGRAREVRDDLKAKDKLAETDLLQIQLDAHAPVLVEWQAQLLDRLRHHAGDPRYAAMLPYVADWGGAALPGSIGYRLVRSYEEEAVRLVYGGFGAAIKAAAGADAGLVTGPQAEWPTLRLLRAQPPRLLPPPYKSWTEIDVALLAKLQDRVDQQAGGNLAQFTWGARNHTGIHHPLARAVPLLGLLTDPPDEPIAGDQLQPRVVVPGDGASERFVVSPGRESEGIFELPAGEAGNPLTPYFLAGHRNWVEGRPSPYLPGPARWTLTLQPR